MDSLYLLIPIAILLISAALSLFFWAVNSDQYDDLETESQRILFDDDLPASKAKNSDKCSESKAATHNEDI